MSRFLTLSNNAVMDLTSVIIVNEVEADGSYLLNLSNGDKRYIFDSETPSKPVNDYAYMPRAKFIEMWQNALEPATQLKVNSF